MSRVSDIADALEDACPWIQTREGWEAAALLRQMEDLLRMHLSGNHLEANTKALQLLENTYAQPKAQV